MLKITLILTSVFLFVSCQEKLEPIEVIKEVEVQPELIEEDYFNYDTLKGIYTGDFAGSKIRIIVNYSSNTNAIGYNIHKGLQRNISGKVLNSNDTIFMTLAEPGDHKYDGVFNLTFIGEDQHPTAIWASNSGKIKPKTFSLTKKVVEEFDDDKLNENSIPAYFDSAMDSIGIYNFDEDGFVVFIYYPSSDKENRIEQYQEIKGTWSFNDKKITIDWENNDLFGSSEIFSVIKNDYEFHMIEEGGRTITPSYW